MTTGHALERLGELLDIMDQLRGPGGCPWDARQTPETLKPYLIEEAYELLEAIDLGEPAAICEELGDLLLQVVFHSAIFSERGDFTFADVAQGIAAKMRRRHPHVFAATTYTDETELHRQWEAIKLQEKGPGRQEPDLLAGIPTALPPTQRACKIIERTTRAGVVWPETAECEHLAASHLAALSTRSCSPTQSEEIFGRLLLTLQLLAKQLQIDPERALHRALDTLSQRLISIVPVGATTEEGQTKITRIDGKKLL